MSGANAVHAQTFASTTRDAVLLTPASKVTSSRAAVAAAPSAVITTRSGPALQQSTTSSRKRSSGAVDTLTITTAKSLRNAGYSAVAADGARPDAARDINYVREWPSAAEVRRPGYTVAVTPEAGVGYGSYGSSAQAGATVKLTPAERDAKMVKRLGKMGIAEGDAAYGDDEGRWYLFAAAKGRAVGLNMTNGGDRAMSTDPVALVGDAQAGVGWRKGDVQASVGYTRRSIRARDPYINMLMSHRDELVGLNLSYVPGR